MKLTDRVRVARLIVAWEGEGRTQDALERRLMQLCSRVRRDERIRLRQAEEDAARQLKLFAC